MSSFDSVACSAAMLLATSSDSTTNILWGRLPQVNGQDAVTLFNGIHSYQYVVADLMSLLAFLLLLGRLPRLT